jgi:ribosomal protein S18 acetylase RimI-like enzyme
MEHSPLRDKRSIETFLRRNPELHIYAIGDLDAFFWPYTTWYGRVEVTELQDVVLIYGGNALPTVIALAEKPDGMRALLTEIVALLPEKFHAHLTPGVEEVFRGSHALESHGLFYRMAWRASACVDGFDCSRVIQLSASDLGEVLGFYRQSYPGNWFDARMLETKRYFGLREAGCLICVGGVHVYSARYRVAALGNIATHPDHRGKGHATVVTARLCQVLRDEVDHIGLNVKADNEAAVACYRKLGFEFVTPYGEFNITGHG